MACCAVFCKSRTLKGGVKVPELSFHTFPKSPEIRNLWIKAVRRKNWEPTKFSRLCSKHFDESSFVTGLAIKRLKTDVVPTIFEHYSKYYQPVVKKRKQQQRHENQDWPSQQKSVEAGEVESDELPTPLMKVTASLATVRKLASRRLRLAKSLRERNRRLQKKNAKLIGIINYLTNRESVK